MGAPRGHVEGNRALAVGAHPDDIDVNAGGTIAKWVAAGFDVTYLVVTSGDAGGYGSVSREEIVATRQEEQRGAARTLGVNDVRFLEGYRDGSVEVHDDLVRDIVRVIRQVRPQRVMAMSPERDWMRVHQGHPDHLAVGEATMRAVYPAARNPFAYPQLLEVEELEAWSVEEVWVQAHPQPNHFEDITDEMSLKEQAVLAHVSQFPDLDGFFTFFRAEHARNAERAGMPEGRYAESFLRADTR